MRITARLVGLPRARRARRRLPSARPERVRRPLHTQGAPPSTAGDDTPPTHATVLQTPALAPEQANKLCIILSKGTLDMAYPAFMLAQTAAAMGDEVHVFFTFWGMSAIQKKTVDKLSVASVGNPGLPMPNILGMLPGMTALATRMMKSRIARAKIATLHDMIKDCAAMGVQLHACSTTMEVMGVKREDFIPEVTDVVGAASFLEMAQGGQTLFI